MVTLVGYEEAHTRSTHLHTILGATPKGTSLPSHLHLNLGAAPKWTIHLSLGVEQLRS